MSRTRGHVPVRLCIGCRQRKPQGSLRRFVRAEGTWMVDASAHREGRGTYLCSVACAAASAKNRRYPGLATVAVEALA